MEQSLCNDCNMSRGPAEPHPSGRSGKADFCDARSIGHFGLIAADHPKRTPQLPLPHYLHDRWRLDLRRLRAFEMFMTV